jgi:hypothetical protein
MVGPVPFRIPLGEGIPEFCPGLRDEDQIAEQRGEQPPQSREISLDLSEFDARDMALVDRRPA